MREYSWVILVVVLVVIFVLKRRGMIGPEDARALMSQGAKVIDVRTPSEFAGRHFNGALNLPLASIGSQIGGTVRDKDAPVLLYCLSGTRSSAAGRILRHKGYTNVHNLGTVGRTERILGPK